MSGVARGDRRKGWRGPVTLALLIGLLPTIGVLARMLIESRPTAAAYRDHLYRRYLESKEHPSHAVTVATLDRS